MLEYNHYKGGPIVTNIFWKSSIEYPQLFDKGVAKYVPLTISILFTI